MLLTAVVPIRNDHDDNSDNDDDNFFSYENVIFHRKLFCINAV